MKILEDFKEILYDILGFVLPGMFAMIIFIPIIFMHVFNQEFRAVKDMVLSLWGNIEAFNSSIESLDALGDKIPDKVADSINSLSQAVEALNSILENTVINEKALFIVILVLLAYIVGVGVHFSARCYFKTLDDTSRWFQKKFGFIHRKYEVGYDSMRVSIFNKETHNGFIKVLNEIFSEERDTLKKNICKRVCNKENKEIENLEEIICEYAEVEKKDNQKYECIKNRSSNETLKEASKDKFIDSASRFILRRNDDHSLGEKYIGKYNFFMCFSFIIFILSIYLLCNALKVENEKNLYRYIIGTVSYLFINLVVNINYRYNIKLNGQIVKSIQKIEIGFFKIFKSLILLVSIGFVVLKIEFLPFAITYILFLSLKEEYIRHYQLEKKEAFLGMVDYLTKKES